MHPDDEHLRIKEIERAQKAQTILDSPMFAEAIQAMKETFLQAWAETAASDVSTRETCYFLHGMVYKFQQILQETLETGKMSRQQLDEMAENRRVQVSAQRK